MNHVLQGRSSAGNPHVWFAGTLAGIVAAAFPLMVAAGVMDDCVMLFHGGSDYNGNGCFDDGELRDRLHPGTVTDVVKRAWDFPADCITWTNMSVQCNCKSNVLENQTCLYFHQKGMVNNVLTDKACALELPRFGYSADEVASADYAATFTALFRVRLPAADTKADGTVLTGADVGTAGACGTLAALGNCQTDGQWKGTDIAISHSQKSPLVNERVQNWSKGTIWTNDPLYLTNKVYTTRDAEWVEIAVRGRAGTYNNKPCPNISSYVWRWDGSMTNKGQGGRNGAPCNEWPTLLGNNSKQSMTQGFQGAVHMVALWKRELSDSECKEAFEFLSGPMDTMAHDGNTSGLYKIGFDDSDGSLFGGSTGGETALTVPNRYVTDFPSNFTAGTKLTIRTPLDNFTKNMKQVLRVRTAANSAAGVLAIKANGTVLKSQQPVMPAKTYLFYLPETLFAGDEFVAELSCTSAGVGGIRLTTVEVCGSWTIGLKDNSTTQIVPGKASTATSTVRTFTVGTDPMTSFPTYWYDYDKNRTRSYTDINFYVPAGLEKNFQYVFKGSSRGGYVDPTTGAPHDYTLNDTKKSERFFFTNVNNGQDYAMTIDPGDLQAGWNTIHCQNYMTNTMNGASVKYWAYTYWDYVTLQVVKQKIPGVAIIVR